MLRVSSTAGRADSMLRVSSTAGRTDSMLRVSSSASRADSIKLISRDSHRCVDVWQNCDSDRTTPIFLLLIIKYNLEHLP
jgi:hypothetical protein